LICANEDQECVVQVFGQLWNLRDLLESEMDLQLLRSCVRLDVEPGTLEGMGCRLAEGVGR